MEPMDALWLHMDHPTNLMMITAVLTFGGPLSRSALRALVRDRIVAPYPRFAQRVVAPKHLGGSPRWEPVRHLDLDAHLGFEQLPAPANEAALQDRVGQLMSAALPASRPLWQLTVVEGLADGGSAIIARIHHCLADGMALAQVLLSLTDEATPLPPADPTDQHLGFGALIDQVRHLAHDARVGSSRLLHAGASLRAHPGRLVDGARKAADAARELGYLLTLPADHPTRLKGALGRTKHATWTPSVPLSRVKAIGQPHGATINDVLLAATTGSLRRWLLAEGHDVPEVRAFIPVNLRPLDRPVPRALGNRFSLVFLGLPVGLDQPADRLAEVKRRMDLLKTGTEAVVAFGLLHAIGMAPPAIERVIIDIFGSKASAVMTNVPGPRKPIHLAGVQVQGIWFWVPQAGRVGLGVSIFSYAGEVSVGVASDAQRMPDPGALAATFTEELDALERALPSAARMR